MKLKTKIKLLTVLMVCMTASLIAGCKVGGITKDEFLNKYDAAGQYVTYYANGGKFNGKARTEVDMYYRPGSYIICSEQSNFTVARTNYNFSGWYYIQSDADGNPALDGDGNYIFGDQVVETDTVDAGVHLLVAAQWTAIVAIDVYLVTDDGLSVTATDGVQYQSGDLIKTCNFGSSNKPYGLSQSRDGISATNATFLYFFSDAECTLPINEVSMPADDEEEGEPEENPDETKPAEVENVKVYVKYLRGDWKVVSVADSPTLGVPTVKTMFADFGGNGNYYLFSANGSGVIDCSGITVNMSSGNFNINLQGNGVVLNNLTVSGTNLRSSSYSVFGSLTSNAVLSGLVLKNVKVTAALTQNAYVFLVTNGAAAGAQIDGLTIENISMTVTTTRGSEIYNIYADDSGKYYTGNWMFGGVTTDAQFLEDYDVTVTGASLAINSTVVI